MHRLARAHGQARLLAGRRSRAARLPRPLAQTTVTLETPSKRGDIYDRTGTVVLATTVQRERLVAAPDQLTPERRRATVAGAGRASSSLDEAAAVALRDRLTGDAKYLILRHGLERDDRRPDPRGDRRQARLRPVARAGARAGLPAGRRRAGIDASRRTSSASSTARAAASTASSSTTRRRSPASRGSSSPSATRAARRCSSEAVVSQAGAARHGPAPDDRRRPPAAGRAGAARRLGRRPGEARLGGRHGSVHRRDLRDGDLSVLRRQRLQGDRRDRPGAVHRPDRLDGLRARLGVQDDDRGGRPANGTVTPTTRIKDVGTLRLDKGRTKIDDADRKGMGWMTFEDAIAYSRNVVAAKVALGLGETTQRVVGDPLRHVAAARLRRADRDRRGRRGRRHRPRSGAHQVARDRPRQRRVRPGRGGHPDPAGDGVRRADERRDARPAARRQGDRRATTSPSRRAARGHRRRACRRRSSR